MARMTAMQAAIRVFESEGVEVVFGIPGAAILPFSRRSRRAGSSTTWSARRRAARMPPRAKAAPRPTGSGSTSGTSGPAGTDMITGLYLAMADSIPILCITGQAPRAKLHKEDFQAIDIAAIARPVTKWSVCVMEGAQVPWVFRQGVSGDAGRPPRPGAHRPADRRPARGDRIRPGGRRPLEVIKPKPNRSAVEKALAMLLDAERPLIVTGGGVSFVEIAREWDRAGRIRRRNAWVAKGADASGRC